MECIILVNFNIFKKKIGFELKSTNFEAKTFPSQLSRKSYCIEFLFK